MVHTNNKIERKGEVVLWLKSERIKMDSLEESVFMFNDEEYYSNESELHEDLWCQDNTHSDGSPDNTLYWESQVSLLQVQILFLFRLIFVFLDRISLKYIMEQ